MPQIAQFSQILASQIFWLLVAFGLVYFVIGRAMLPKIGATVDLRERTVTDDLAAAQAARVVADATEETWRVEMASARSAAQAETASAKTEAAKAADLRLKAADTESAGAVARAEHSIRLATAEALAQIESAAGEATREMVAKLSGVSVSPAVASAAVRKAMMDG